VKEIQVHVSAPASAIPHVLSRPPDEAHQQWEPEKASWCVGVSLWHSEEEVSWEAGMPPAPGCTGAMPCLDALLLLRLTSYRVCLPRFTASAHDVRYKKASSARCVRREPVRGMLCAMIQVFMRWQVRSHSEGRCQTRQAYARRAATMARCRER